ncbi:MAG: hypothetical protein R2745_17220 [Vicinamibacterales bacterium]
MPPCLDTYVVSERTRAVIERFLDRYVDRELSEDRGSEQLLVAPVESLEGSEPARWAWEPEGTLTAVIERGLADPSSAFVVYLRPKDRGHHQAILAFTTDDAVVCGVSLDDPDDAPEVFKTAQALLEDLATQLSAVRGFIGVEQPPPLTGTTTDHEVWLLEWHRGAA